MTERTVLGEAILAHWRANNPQMVRELESKKRLSRILQQAQDRAADLIYELVSVQKMDYQTAWELALRDWTQPPSKHQPRPYRTSNRRCRRQETSA